ncbi:MAG: ABC-F family ATP-binding cassette domain-containing protein [Thermomicrobiales bacterium]|nr:ABC-F family ATP-binding cassette domain-containing protein [Thermomicrobiales bacterium]
MLYVNKISKRFPDGPVLDEITFSIKTGEKVGLVGANGSGKSTLLRIIAGLETPDEGSVRLEPGIEVGYLVQQVEEAASTRVVDLLTSGQEAWQEAGRDLDDAIARMSRDPGDVDALDAYGDALERFEALGGYGVQTSIDRICAGLGVVLLDLDRQVAGLSGGEKTRVALGALLLSGSDLLLLDEPTNHLDLPALTWLEEWILSAPQAAIIVSHDRAFLDRTVSRILFLDERSHQLSIYQGGYTDFQEARRRERDVEMAAWRDQQEKIERVEREIRELKNRARRTENSTIDFAIRKIAKGTARRAIVQERRLQRDLDGDQRLERPAYDKALYLAGMARSGSPDRRLILTGRDLSVDLGGNRILEKVDVELHGGDRVWLSGPNGSGKTTLLSVLAGERRSSGDVVRGSGVKLGYLKQEHTRSSVPLGQTVLEATRSVMAGEESAIRALLDQFLFTGQDVMKKVVNLSYGERLRLELAKLVGGGAGALLLDEPTNHLDVSGIERLQAALAAYQGPMVVVSHDRAFLHGINLTTEWPIQDGRIVPVSPPRLTVPGEEAP